MSADDLPPPPSGRDLPPPPSPGSDVPPPPTPDMAPPPPAAVGSDGDDGLTALWVGAALIVVAAVLVGFAGGANEGVAFATGSAFASLLLTVGIGALIGWGNKRRALIATIAVGVFVIFSRVAAAGST